MTHEPTRRILREVGHDGAIRDIHRAASMIDRAYVQDALPPSKLEDTGACAPYSEPWTPYDDDSRGSEMLGYVLGGAVVVSVFVLGVALSMVGLACLHWAKANHWFSL